MRRVLLLMIGLAALSCAALADDLLELPGGLVERIQQPGAPTVLLQALPDLPSVSVALVVPAGSRHDGEGRSGEAHLLEHLLFRATRTYPNGQLLVNLEQIGARAGARTSPDYILFWETLPAQYLDFSLKTQADRLHELYADENDLAREKSLALWEMAADESQESRLLRRLTEGLWPTLGPAPGRPNELRDITLAQLQSRYAATIAPENAVLVVVGGFSPRLVRRKLRTLFPAPVEATAPLKTPPRPAPKRTGLQVDELGPPTLEMLFPLPDTAPTLAELYLLDAALTGGSGGQLAHSGRTLTSQFSPELTFYRLRLNPNARETVAQVEEHVASEVNRLTGTELLPDQLQTARDRALASFYRELESPGRRASLLAVRQAEGRLDQMVHMPEELKKVTGKQLLETARAVLKFPEAAIGRLTGSAPSSTPAPAPDDEARTELGPGPVAQAGEWKVDEQPAPPPPAFTRHELENGMTVLVQTVSDLPTVTVRGYLKGGTLLDPLDRPGLTYLAGSLLGEGTSERPGESFAWDLQDLGAELTFEPDQEVIAIKGWTMSSNFPAFMAMLTDALRRAAPDEEAIARVRLRALAEHNRELANPVSRAAIELRSRLFPAGHPFGQSLTGNPTVVSTASRAEVLAHMRRITRPDRLVLVFSGDVSNETVLRLLRPDLTAWYVQQTAPLITVPPVPTPQAQAVELKTERANSLMVMGQLGPSRRDSDFYAFNLLNQILGGNPITSRLALRLRDRDQLAAQITSRLVSSSGPAPWAVTLRLKPGQEQAADQAVRQEIDKLRRQAPSASEIEQAVRALEGKLQVSQGTAAGRAELLANLEFHRLADSYTEGFSGIYRRLGPKELLETAKKRLDPEQLVTVTLKAEADSGNP